MDHRSCWLILNLIKLKSELTDDLTAAHWNPLLKNHNCNLIEDEISKKSQYNQNATNFAT